MKTSYIQGAYTTPLFPCTAPVGAKGTEMSKLMKKTMKPKLTLLITALCAVAATSVFGQTTYTWIGTLNGGDGTNITTAANYTTNEPGNIPAITLPNGTGNGTVGDTIQWDNQSPPSGGNVLCTYNNGLPGTGFGTSGLNLLLTANQTGNVQIAPVGGATGNFGFNSIIVNSANAIFDLGDGSGNANTLNIVTRPGTAGVIHQFFNNSANPAYIFPNVRWQAGGAAQIILDFGGTGNWIVTNSLAHANATPLAIQKDGNGTMFWNGPSTPNAAPNSGYNSPFTINAGTIVLQWNNTLLNTIGFVNEGYLQYNAPGQGQTLSGAISGLGTNQIVAGTLTLKGENTYVGNTILSGGEVIVSSAETAGTQGPLGVGGLITFAGGTLGYSAVNTFDYSPRFDTSAGQQYSIDTAGENVTLTNNLTSTGATFTKVGSGTLTITGVNTYNGLTTVSAGKLQIQGTTGGGNITVANGTALGVFEGGSQVTANVLAVGTSAGATLEFNDVNNTATPPLVANSISTGGPITINVNSGSFSTIGQVYPLFKWNGGSPPPVSLGVVVGAAGTLSTNGNVIDLTITGTAFTWTGINNSNWDLTTPNNWKQSGAAATYANGLPTVFDDTAPGGNTNVNIDNAVVQPQTLTINNSILIYSITSSATAYIGGSGSLTKSGSAMATLTGGGNQYTGVTTLNAGILSIGVLTNGGLASDIGKAANSAANVVFNGGTLQYTGTGATSDHLFTLGTAGGTIDDEGTSLTLSNPGNIALSGSGARALTLTGINANGDTLTAVLSDNGGVTAINKLGTGTWILAGLNTNSGTINIASGTLQVGNGGNSSLGSGPVVDDSSLDFDMANKVTNNVISGSGSVTNSGTGTLILPGNSTYVGDTYVDSGTLQIGNGGASGQINPGAGALVVDNGTIVFDSTGICTLAGFNNGITGTGNVIVEGNGGTFAAYGPNTYSGWTLINAGAIFEPSKGNSGALDSSICTNNGELLLVRQDNGIFITQTPIVGTGFVWKDANNPNVGDVTLDGTNTYTGGTFINGGTIILGDDANPGRGAIVGNVIMTFNSLNTENSTIEFNRPDTTIFPGIISGYGNVTQSGSGTLILTGNNTYTNSITTVSASTTLQVGNGSAAGTISVDNVTDNGTLVYDRSDSVTAANLISGTGGVVQDGTGSVNLSATNFYTGATVVSNGTLIVSGQSFPNGSGLSTPNGTSVGGELDVSGGTLVSGGAGTVFSNSVAGNLNINSGSLAITLNRSLTQSSNTYYVVTGTIINNSSAGFPASLVVANSGPPVVAGDVFVVFNQAMQNAAGASAVTISSPSMQGVTWENDLANNGTIKVLTAQISVPTISSIAVSGNKLTFSATNGTPSGQYVVLETTNLSPPVVWKPVFTNSFNASGNIVNLSTNVLNPSIKAEFFNLSQP